MGICSSSASSGSHSPSHTCLSCTQRSRCHNAADANHHVQGGMSAGLEALDHLHHTIVAMKAPDDGGMMMRRTQFWGAASTLSEGLSITPLAYMLLRQVCFRTTAASVATWRLEPTPPAAQCTSTRLSDKHVISRDLMSRHPHV